MVVVTDQNRDSVEGIPTREVDSAALTLQKPLEKSDVDFKNRSASEGWLYKNRMENGIRNEVFSTEWK